MEKSTNSKLRDTESVKNVKVLEVPMLLQYKHVKDVKVEV